MPDRGTRVLHEATGRTCLVAVDASEAGYRALVCSHSLTDSVLEDAACEVVVVR